MLGLMSGLGLGVGSWVAHLEEAEEVAALVDLGEACLVRVRVRVRIRVRGWLGTRREG